jgi:ArsR family transcriptional regulator, arsenate/arsenite/antimonite-responsive transcriptional repressor
MRELLAITRALDNEHRLRILMSVRAGEVCLCHLAEVLRLAPSTVSRHVELLRQAGLVEVRKEGRWHHYRLAGRDASPEVRAAIRWISKALADEADISADLTRLDRIRTATPEESNACATRN